MGELKKQTITIFDDKYTIVSDESEDNLAGAVEYTNRLMSSVSVQSGIADKKKVAVLSALQMAMRVSELEYQLKMVRDKEEELVSFLDQHSDAACLS